MARASNQNNSALSPVSRVKAPKSGSAGPYLYGNIGSVDNASDNAVLSFLNNTFANQKQTVDPTAAKSLANINYKPYDFKNNQASYAYGNGGSKSIQSVADLPEDMKKLIMDRALSGIGSTAEGQRLKAKDDFLRMGGRSSGYASALRDINSSEMKQAGDTATQSLIDEANRRYQEAQNVRQMDIANEQYKTGLADTAITRDAAEQEKAYQAKYGQAQDLINNAFNTAAFNSGEVANQASREQAGVTQAMNYLGQGSTYGLNLQQLANKKPSNSDIVGAKNDGSAALPQNFGFQQPQSSSGQSPSGWQGQSGTVSKFNSGMSASVPHATSSYSPVAATLSNNHTNYMTTPAPPGPAYNPPNLAAGQGGTLRKVAAPTAPASRGQAAQTLLQRGAR